MNSDFAKIVESAQKLSRNEKEELKFLLEKYLIEERREEFKKNYKKSIAELQKNKLKFSGKADGKHDEVY